MATTEATSEHAPAATPAGKRAQSPALAAVHVLFKGVLLLFAAYATAFAVTVFVPEDGDYVLAARIQHRQLAAPVPKKVVLIGGSNLAFGVDSTMIEAASRCHVANMGINGYLGVRFMLAQAEANLNPGDIAVLAFEYDSFFKSVEGTPSAQVVLVKTTPVTLNYFTIEQKLTMLRTVPFVAQQKILRLLGQAYDRIIDPAELKPSFIHQIETVSGVTRNGDLVSHIGREWPYDLEDGLDASKLPVDGEVIAILRDFAARMQERGVHVVMSYTPVLRDYYDRHRASLEHLDALVRQAPPLVAPSAPRDYVYDERYFFDTVYHLNGDGRTLRTQRLINDLQRQLGDSLQCGLQAGAPTQGGHADD